MDAATSGSFAAVAIGATTNTGSSETSLAAITEVSGNRESSKLVSVVETETETLDDQL